MMVPDPSWVKPEVAEGEEAPTAPLVEVANPDTKIPSDGIEITEDQHRDLLAGQGQGKCIAVVDGVVALVDPPGLSDEQAQANMIATRENLLAKADDITTRHRDQVDAGTKTTLTDAQYKATLAYKQALRDLPDIIKDPHNIIWPDAPWATK